MTPGMSKATTRTRLAPEDARRALYVDFEGQIDQAPVLLGCTRWSRFGQVERVWQAVTDPRFDTIARADGIESLTLSNAVERILQRAERKSRLIVAWTEHELDVVRDHCPEKLDRFQVRFVNARAVAVYWRNKCHGGQKPASNALADYLELVGWPVPEGAGPGVVGTTIAIIRRSLERDPSGRRLTDKQRRRWGALREHNRHDCAGMRRVCLTAAREIAVHNLPDSSPGAPARCAAGPMALPARRLAAE
jgi:hypothetical protein